MRREKLYWICQVVGWGIYILFMMIMIQLSNDPQYHNQGIFQLNLVIGATLFGISHCLRTIFKKHRWDQFSLLKLSMSLIGILALASILSQLIINPMVYLVLPVTGIKQFSLWSTLMYVFQVNIIFWLWAIIYFSVHYFQNLRKSEVEKYKAEVALKDLELLSLKQQIDPHFMFNALNNIRMLILEDAMRARDAVTQLSELLRYSLNVSKSNFISLKEELNVVENYLELQKVQFEERLDYAFDVEETHKELMVPPMTVQLLVENAVKHGISQLVAGGKVEVQTNIHRNNLIVQVRNNGRLENARTGTSVGLQNIRERLCLLYGENEGVRLWQEEESLVIAQVSIPIEKQ